MFINVKTWSTFPSLEMRGLLAIFGRKAFGFRSNVDSTASCLTTSCSLLLQQFTQLHPSQYVPDAKHSQYLPHSHQPCQRPGVWFRIAQFPIQTAGSRQQAHPHMWIKPGNLKSNATCLEQVAAHSFRHREFLQLHCLHFLGVPSLPFKAGRGRATGLRGELCFLVFRTYTYTEMSRKIGECDGSFHGYMKTNMKNNCVSFTVIKSIYRHNSCNWEKILVHRSWKERKSLKRRQHTRIGTRIRGKKVTHVCRSPTCLAG